MTILVSAVALAIAAPAAAQPAAHADHGGHAQHQQGEHQQGRHQQGAHQDCPCCRPAADGTRPSCCERMHGQQGGQTRQPQHQGQHNH